MLHIDKVPTIVFAIKVDNCTLSAF